MTEHGRPTTPATDADSSIKAVMDGADARDAVGDRPDGQEKETKESQGEDGAVTAGEQQHEPSRSRAKIAIIMTALGMAVFLAALDVTIVTTALPSISAHFQSAAAYTWIGSVYLLAHSASTPIWGKISDIWGRKPILLLANLVFLVGSLLAAVSINVGMMIAARAIQGIGGGGLIVLVNICISDLFSMRSRSAYFGVIGGVWALASALGPVIGGLLTEKVSWRWCFYINLPLDGAAFIIILLYLDLQTPKTPLWEGLRAIDWLGALTIVGGTVMLLFGLELGGVSRPWRSATVLCLIIFGALTIALFTLIERTVAARPIIPLRLFTHRSNVASLLVCAFHGAVFISSSYFLPLYFQAARGASPLRSGVYLLPTVLSLSLASAAAGVVIRKTGSYVPLIRGGLALMTLGAGLFVDFAADSSWPKLILYQIVAGLGVGPNFQSPLIALQAFIPPADIATATATFGFVRHLATAVSVVLGSVVFNNAMQGRAGTLVAELGAEAAAGLGGASAGANVGVVQGLAEPGRGVARRAFAESLRPMWVMYVVLAGLGLVSSLFVQKKRLSRVHEETRTGLEAERRRERVRGGAGHRGGGDVEAGKGERGVIHKETL